MMKLLSFWELHVHFKMLIMVLHVHLPKFSHFEHCIMNFVNPFASEAVYTRNFFFDRMSDSV